MPSNSLLFLAFVSLFSLSLHIPQQAIAASGGRFLKAVRGGNGSPPPAGICSAAINVHGYKCQEFNVTTDDGYILSVQRIPNGRTGGGSENRPPVLLQHGVLVDGMSWLLNSPRESLAMILADNGFDVWISNVRGTRFSLRHVTLDPSNPEYWNWSWDDLMSHDLASIIELIFKKTGQKTHYVGHSMGTLMALASLAEGKFEKVKSAALLSPIAYLSHMKTALGIIATRAFAGEITTMFGLAEFNPEGKAVANFLKALCAARGVHCYDFLTAFTGKNCCLNGSTVELVLKNEPQPTSTKNLIHFAQTARGGVLSKYNYGNSNANLKHYGNSKPPVYELTKIPRDFPLFLSYGGKDALSDVKDVSALLDSLVLHDRDKLKVQYVEEYAHADFIMAVNAKDVVYSQIVAFFKSYN